MGAPASHSAVPRNRRRRRARGRASLLGWGWNDWGQLGDGSKSKRTTPVWVAPNLDAKKIAGGGYGNSGDFTVALSTDGTVWAWGNNISGQLGNGTFADSTTPRRVGLLTDVVDIAAGGSHGVAVRSDGSVWIWGWMQSPAYAPVATTPDRLPVRVFGVGLSDIVAVAAGVHFSLALRNDGRVFAWGSNTYGELGDGSGVYRASPAQVPGLTAVRSISAGSSSSFAIKSNGSVVAWGLRGTLGVVGTVNRLSPVAVPGLSNVEQISATYNGLARTTAGDVWFWGTGFYGESGDGGVSGVYPTPVQVPGLQQITGVAVGAQHCLALQSNGMVWAWAATSMERSVSRRLAECRCIRRTLPSLCLSPAGDWPRVSARASARARDRGLAARGSAWRWSGGRPPGWQPEGQKAASLMSSWRRCSRMRARRVRSERMHSDQSSSMRVEQRGLADSHQPVRTRRPDYDGAR